MRMLALALIVATIAAAYAAGTGLVQAFQSAGF